MKPIFLKFCGINSYEEEFCIDFESLAAEGIFGIFGATGSGKSTILDAITLALYGKMPRHNKNTHSSFMNVALNTAYVEFIFEAALQGGGQRARFEIHRVYKRNSKGGVNISKSLLREVGGDILADRKESEVNAAIIANLGLNYEDFTRSVFLPQGKFNEFMFLDSRDRGKMLERLFDLEKFGEALKLRVNAVEARAEMAVEACALKISFYGDISQEKLSVKENLLAQTAAEVAHLADEKELFFAEREKYMALDAAYSQYLAARQERERHEARAARMESAAAALDAARAADALLKPINALKSLVSQHEQAKSSLSAMGQLAKAARQQAKMHDSEYQAAREAMETDFPALSEKEQQLNAHLERLFEIENAEREILDLRRKWKIEEGRLKQKRKHLEEGNAKIAEIKGILEDVSLRKLEASVDSEVLKMLIEAAGIEKDLYSKNHEIGVLDEELSGHKGAVLDCSAALEAKQYLLSELFAKNQESLAGQLAQNLEDGLPCPVCGSLHHPAPANHTESLDDGADSERLRDEIEDIKARLNRARAMQEAAAETLAKLEHDRDGLANSLAAYQKSLSLENFDTALQAAFEKNTARAALEEHETALRAELESLETAQKSLLFEVSRHVSAQEATRAAGKEKVLAVEAKRAALGAFGGHEEATAQLENVQSQKLALVITRKESEDLRNKYQLDSLEFEKNLASLTERAHNLAEMRGQQQAAIDEKLAACGFDSIEVALGASLPREQMAALEAEIEDYQQKKAETASLLANLSKVLEDIDNPQNIPEIAGAAREKFAAADATLMEKREVAAILSQEVAKMTVDLADAARLQSQKKGLEARHAALREIADLFRGNAFVKFLAARHLQYITNEATGRLARMTGGRYAIEYDEDAGFIIRDDFNGGARRPPASLSGGETFMASLCLALALSAKIQMKSRTDLSFFFLDEGFGSLDSDSLGTVMDALGQLHQENMTVGIISHVDEMKHRIHNKIEL